MERTRRIIEAMREAAAEGKGAVSLDGRLIDAASIRMAENLLAKLEQIEARDPLAVAPRRAAGDRRRLVETAADLQAACRELLRRATHEARRETERWAMLTPRVPPAVAGGADRVSPARPWPSGSTRSRSGSCSTRTRIRAA